MFSWHHISILKKRNQDLWPKEGFCSSSKWNSCINKQGYHFFSINTNLIQCQSNKNVEDQTYLNNQENSHFLIEERLFSPRNLFYQRLNHRIIIKISTTFKKVGLFTKTKYMHTLWLKNSPPQYTNRNEHVFSGMFRVALFLVVPN